jgi:hypothetical protein
LVIIGTKTGLLKEKLRRCAYLTVAGQKTSLA